MRVERHGENLVQLRNMGFINAYLVQEPEGWTLVDTTGTGQAQAILEAVQTLGGCIVRIVATHAHNDHVGSLDALAEALPDAEVALGEREARILSGDLSLLPGEPETPLARYAKLQRSPDRTLLDGDTVGHLRVVASPGHTPGHTAFVDARDGTLFCGDALFTMGGLGVAGIRRLRFCLPSLATWDRRMALASGQRLADQRPTRIAPGHGPVLPVSQTDMQGAVAKLAEQLAR